MKFCYFVSFTFLAVLTAGGCGGGSGSGGHESSSSAIKFTVDWAARSRGIGGPSSALSAKLTLTGAGSGGHDFTYVFDRTAGTAAYSQEYTSSDAAKTGAHTLSVQFYSQAGGQGDVVGTASETVTIDKSGGGIGSVTTVPTITSVAVTAYQTVQVPDTAPLAFTATNAQNELVAVSPGSGFWSLSDGGDSLSVTSDGMATAIKGGTANVKVTVDGISSSTTPVVVPQVPAFQNGDFESPALATDDWQQASATGWDGENARGIGNGSNQWGYGGHGGSQFAYIQSKTLSPGQGALIQSVSGLVVGRKYKVSFWIRRRTGGDILFGVDPNVGGPLEVWVDGTQIATTTTPTGDDWTQFTTDAFTATKDTSTFKFTPTLPYPAGNKTDLLDDIVLVPVSG